ncbi:MAG TPA: DHA2 family efflux MFS transporter permease subunit [Pseudonocardia sp.]|jgi:EmrB/QacA subfamily drug resistance transporter
MEAVSAPPPGVAGTPSTVRQSWGLPLAVLVVGMFMSVLDTSIVNVAIPTMQRDFGASTDDIQWITNAYMLALGVVVPLSGWLGDRLGMTRAYLYSLIAFSAASALCGMAWDLNSMIAFRILQAVPGGIIPVVTMTMVYHLVPPEKMGSAMGMYSLGIILGPAIGPTLGGYLVEYVNWRLIFFINVPVGALGAVAVLLALPPIASDSRRPLDWWGFLTIASGLFALLLASSKGPDWGWTSYKVLILATFAVLALALFVVVELANPQPLIDLRVFKTWMFTNSLMIITILSIGLYSILFYLPLFMQESQGLPALRAGLLLLPEALTMAAVMPVAGLLYDRFGPRWPAVIGLVIAAFGGFLLVGITPDMTTGEVILWTCVRAAGNSLAMMPIFTGGLAAIPPEYVNSGSPANNIAQRGSAALGLAAMTALFTARSAQIAADRSAMISDHNTLPLVRSFTGQGFTGLYGYFQVFQADVTAAALSDMFLVAAWLTVLGIGLALFMKQPEADAPAEPTATEPTAGAPTARAGAAGAVGAVGAPVTAVPANRPDPAPAPSGSDELVPVAAG